MPMTKYRIQEIDPARPEYTVQVLDLLRASFAVDLTLARLIETTRTVSAMPTLHLCAVSGNDIVGFVSFMPQSFTVNGKAAVGYQPCWGATDAAWRGKGIFPALFNAAKEILRQRSVAFLFAFGNPVSHAIFVEKLGFRDFPSLKWQVPNLPFIYDRLIRVKPVSSHDAVLQDDRELLERRRRIADDEPLVIERDSGLIWAVRRPKRKYGLGLSYLDIGGFSLHEPSALKDLVHGLSSIAERAQYLQMTTTAGSTFNELFRGLRAAQTNDLAVCDLALDTSQFSFNLFGGVRDVF
jgi:predicted N-acetyltransferase YhbS